VCNGGYRYICYQPKSHQSIKTVNFTSHQCSSTLTDHNFKHPCIKECTHLRAAQARACIARPVSRPPQGPLHVCRLYGVWSWQPRAALACPSHPAPEKAKSKLSTWPTHQFYAWPGSCRSQNTCHDNGSTVGYLSFGPIEKYFMFSVTLACARRTGAAAHVERRRRER
jgi:hypothetical protein